MITTATSLLSASALHCNIKKSLENLKLISELNSTTHYNLENLELALIKDLDNSASLLTKRLVNEDLESPPAKSPRREDRSLTPETQFEVSPISTEPVLETVWSSDNFV